MKPNKSPPHKTIQLRRKTQKVVLPKAYWDLTNKQNDNKTNNNDQARSRNASSQKSSLEKRKKLFNKKSQTMTQAMFKKIMKKVGNDQSRVKERKDESLPKDKRNVEKDIMEIKKYSSQKQEAKNHSRTMTNKILQQFPLLYKQIKNQENHKIIKSKYKNIFHHAASNTNKEKKMLENIQQHLFFWIDRCQQLRQTVQAIATVTPKIDPKNLVSEENSEKQDSFWGLNDSQMSICSYLADPQIQVSVKAVRPELKEKLHLNFSKVEEYRKKELQGENN